MKTPESQPPAGGLGEWFRGAGGLRLRLGYWPGHAGARGTVFISPGRSEPIEKYYELVADLIEQRFAVVVHDWRGQGLSARLLPDRLKGHARSCLEFVEDYRRLLDGFEDRAPKPWIMLGHSMGGALNLASLMNGESRISAAFLCSPMIRVKTGGMPMWLVRLKTAWKVNQGLGSDYVPELFDDPFEHTFERDALSSDPRRYELWLEHLFACPHLAVGSPTWSWANFAVALGDMILGDKQKRLKRIKTPITIINGTNDSLVNTKTCKILAKKLPRLRLVDVQEAQHELWMERNDLRQQAMSEFLALAETVAPSQSVGKVAPSGVVRAEDEASSSEPSQQAYDVLGLDPA